MAGSCSVRVRCYVHGVRRILLLTIIISAAQIVSISPSVAQEIAVESELIAEVRRDEIGPSGQSAKIFMPAAVLRQGEEVFYTVQVLNPAGEFARQVTVEQRIPQNTLYVPGSAAGPGTQITFSADGGRTFVAENELTVTSPSGASRPATPRDYTHIRWKLHHPLAPGAVALLRFRAVFQ